MLKVSFLLLILLTLLLLGYFTAVYYFVHEATGYKQSSSRNTSHWHAEKNTERLKIESPTNTEDFVDISQDIKEIHTLNNLIQNRLNQFSGLSEQEIIVSLFKAEQRGESLIVETLLALLEYGKLEPNASMRSGSNSQHYTPLFAAMVLDKTLTQEQIEAFILLGAYIQPTTIWARTIGSLEDPDTVELLLSEGRFDHNSVKSVVKHAFKLGNSDTFSVLMDNNEYLKNDFSVTEELISSLHSKQQIKTTVDKLSLLISNSNSAEPSVKKLLEEIRITQGEALVEQIESKLQDFHEEDVDILKLRLKRELEKNKLVLKLPLSTEEQTETAEENIAYLERALSKITN